VPASHSTRKNALTRSGFIDTSGADYIASKALTRQIQLWKEGQIAHAFLLTQLSKHSIQTHRSRTRENEKQKNETSGRVRAQVLIRDRGLATKVEQSYRASRLPLIASCSHQRT